MKKACGIDCDNGIPFWDFYEAAKNGNPVEYSRILKSKFDGAPYWSSDVYEMICQISFKSIITTNYDQYLPKAFGKVEGSGWNDRFCVYPPRRSPNANGAGMATAIDFDYKKYLVAIHGYPLLYHDMERKLMLYNLEEGDTPEVLPDGILGGLLGVMRESYSFRQVHSRNELVEKIRIADAGLDDRVVEIFKVILRGQNTELSEGDLYFSYIQAAPNEDSVIAFYWLGDDGGKEVAMPLATYRAYETHLGNLVAADHEPAGQWQRVDLAYAADLIARQSRSPQS